MNEPQDNQAIAVVTQDSLLSFITTPRALVHAAPNAHPKFAHRSIKACLDLSDVQPVRVGVIDLSSVQWTFWAQFFVARWLSILGLSPDILGCPPPGYYLFADGEPLGFHPGTMDIEHDGASFKIGALTMLFGHLAGDKDAVAIGDGIASLKAVERVVEWTKKHAIPRRAS